MPDGSHRAELETRTLGYLLEDDGLLAASIAPKFWDVLRADCGCKIIPYRSQKCRHPVMLNTEVAVTMDEPLAKQSVCGIKLLELSGIGIGAIEGTYDLVDAL
jgi:hypothetical protein